MSIGIALTTVDHTMMLPPGDSRAVLCRSGVAMPLTDDHKAAREDETVRVSACCRHVPMCHVMCQYSWHFCMAILTESPSLLLASGFMDCAEPAPARPLCTRC